MAANVYTRGGIPAFVAGTTVNPVATEEWHWRNSPLPDGPLNAYATANWLRFQNTGTGAIVLSFSEADADAGVGISVAGPGTVELPVECGRFFTRSAAAEPFVALVALRRGG
jgi:hypothetical protein